MTYLLALTLMGCSAQRSAADVAEDVADATARDAAREVATAVYDEKSSELEERIAALEAASRANLESHASMMKAIVSDSQRDRADVDALREHYNKHLVAQHGAR